MTLLLTIIIIFIDTHLDSKVKTVSENYYTRFIIFLFFLIFYLINRSPLSISVHSFTNSFYCKIDNILFYIMIFILISIALYFGYLKKPFIRINYRVSFLYTNVLLLYIITIAITFKLSNITGLGFKEFYKNVILGLFICLYIISFKKLYKFFYINKKVYKSNVNHIVPAIYLFIVYFFNESSSNFLFTQKIFGNLNCFRVSNFSLTEVNDFVCPDNTLLSNFFNKKYKNLTFLKVNNGYCISAMYRKYNSNIFFEYIDSNNKVKLYFIALVLKFRN